MGFFLYKMNVVYDETHAYIPISGSIEPVSFISPLNVQWRRRYYEFGTFEIYMLAKNYDTSAQFVVNTDTKEVGCIQKVEYKNTAIGEFITISGYMYEFNLCNKSQYLWEIPPQKAVISGPVYPRTLKGFIQYHIFNNSSGSGNLNIQDRNTAFLAGYSDSYIQMEHDITRHFPYVLNTEFDLDSLPTRFNNYQITGDICDTYELGLALQKLLKDENCGLTTVLSDDDKFVIKVIEGKDRTQSQSQNTYCVFSDELNNISNIEYSYDTSNYKNWEVSGATNDRGKMRIVHRSNEIWNQTEYPLTLTREVFNEIVLPDYVDTTGESEIDEYIRKQADMLNMLNYRTIENISFDLIEGYYEYHTDYDLGDKVEVVINALKKDYSYRIIGIDEIYKDNKRTIKLHLGDMKKRIWQKGRY